MGVSDKYVKQGSAGILICHARQLCACRRKRRGGTVDTNLALLSCITIVEDRNNSSTGARRLSQAESRDPAGRPKHLPHDPLRQRVQPS